MQEVRRRGTSHTGSRTGWRDPVDLRRDAVRQRRRRLQERHDLGGRVALSREHHDEIGGILLQARNQLLVR
jgi:hypothetical protein